MAENKETNKILSVDIGGSHIKATVLDRDGKILQAYERVETPKSPDPKSVMVVIQDLASRFPEYQNISVGFPGYVKNGVVKTAPNLGTPAWADFDLAKEVEKALKCPTKVVNDADMQGLGVVSRKGLELVITLGTGFGTALLLDGVLLPHLEMAHHPFAKKKTYDNYIGEKEMDEIGKERWNNRVKKVFLVLKTVFNYDHLYIGGGNASKIDFELDKNMTIVTNKDGIKGGARLWDQ